MSIRFLHAADLHLGCNQFNLDARYEDFFKAFAHIVDIALERKVDAVLLSGDVFHQRAIQATTLARAVAVVSRLQQAGVPVIVTEGNHDKALYGEKQSWLEYMAGAGYIVLLKPDVTEEGLRLRQHDGASGSVLELENCRVIGLGYPGGAVQKRLGELRAQITPGEKPTVIMLHTAVDRLLGIDLGGVAREEVLQYADVAQYMALGHIHARYEVQDFAYNPGAPECVHLDEGEGREKGCYIVELSSAGKSVEFLPVPRRATFYVELDAQTDVKGQLAAQGESYAGALVSLKLKNCPEGYDAPALEAWMKEELGCLWAEVQCRRSGEAARFSYAAIDVEDIERQVLEEMLCERAVERPQETAAFLRRLKAELLSGGEPGDLVEMMQEEGGLCS